MFGAPIPGYNGIAPSDSDISLSPPRSVSNVPLQINNDLGSKYSKAVDMTEARHERAGSQDGDVTSSASSIKLLRLTDRAPSMMSSRQMSHAGRLHVDNGDFQSR